MFVVFLKGGGCFRLNPFKEDLKVEFPLRKFAPSTGKAGKQPIGRQVLQKSIKVGYNT